MERVKTLLQTIRHFSSAGCLRSRFNSLSSGSHLFCHFAFKSTTHAHLTSPPRSCSVPYSGRQVGIRVSLGAPGEVLAISGARSRLLLFSLYPAFLLSFQSLLQACPHHLCSTQSSDRGGLHEHLLSSPFLLVMGQVKDLSHFLTAVALIIFPMHLA